MTQSRMSCRSRPAGALTALAVAGTGIMLSAPIWAQETEAVRARLLTFGTSIGLVADDNPGLDVDPGEASIEASARLDATLAFATPTETFTLRGDAGLRAIEGPGTFGSSDGLADPNAALSYTRTVRDSRLEVDAFLRRSEVAFLVPLTEGFDDPLLLEDLDLSRETGARYSYGMSSRLELRREAPLGLSLSAGLVGRSYVDTEASSTLTDSLRYNAGLGLRLDLTPATRARLDFGYSGYEEDLPGAERRDTFSLGASVSRDRPAGSIGASTQIVSTETGERLRFSIDRALELPLTKISAQLGVVRTEEGDVLPSGRLSMTHALRQGGLSASLLREVRSGADDDERRVTAINLAYDRPLSRLANLGVDLSYIESAPTGAGISESFATASIGYSHALAEDWRLNVDLEHRIEDNGASDTASGNRVSIFLRREFSYQP